MNEWHGTKTPQEPMLCNSLILPGAKPCSNPRCKRLHSIDEYLQIKKPEIDIPCYEYETFGSCTYKYNCVFRHDNNANHTYTNNARQAYPERQKTYNNNPEFYQRLKEIVQAAEAPSADRSEHCDKPRTDFRGKLFLAPMCTVGVLPFRRWCKSFGCDVTCSEMLFARDLLQGSQLERAKIRRHESEDIFGIQITGGRPDDLRQAARLLDEVAQFDYLELNAACPQDIACSRHCGYQIAQDGRINQYMRLLGGCCGRALSLKTRTGDFRGNDTVQQLAERDIAGLPRLDMVVLHGRTAKQRYQRLADWERIRCFNVALKEKWPAAALVGNGDLYGWRDYERYRVGDYSDSFMVGRGALSKPWVFRELRERRTADPRSGERVAWYRQFSEFLIDYYGSDRQGVERAREQFLENWTYLSRYVPSGILEREQQLNQRLLGYYGRDEMEQLLGSQDINDWVKISEMFFGPVPEGFVYQPKHRSKGQVHR